MVTRFCDGHAYIRTDRGCLYASFVNKNDDISLWKSIYFDKFVFILKKLIFPDTTIQYFPASILMISVLKAIANIRGGGEYGEDWNNSGRQLNLQNCLTDFQVNIFKGFISLYKSPSLSVSV